jgi:cyanophycinase
VLKKLIDWNRRRKAARNAEEMRAKSGSILAVGGAEDKFDRPQILERFVAEAGGTEAQVAILPTASAIPDQRAKFYTEVFANLGVAQSFHVPIATRADAEEPMNVAMLQRATGIFMTGGDQSRLVSVLSGTPSFEAIRDRLHGGATIAGTSAGASAFSAVMIVGGHNGLQLRRDAVRLAPGLGVITKLIIDQHFSQRERLGRLLTAVALQPDRLGVGIDEDTAIVYYGTGDIEVIGSGQVFIVDGSRSLTRGLQEDPESEEPFSISGVALHVLHNGDCFRVAEREMAKDRRRKGRSTAVPAAN